MTMSYFRTPPTLLTGRGSVGQIGKEARKLGATKVLIVTDKVIVQAGLLPYVSKPLEAEGILYDVLDEVVPEPPFENLEQMAEKIQDNHYDLFIGIGGGSVLDAAKVLSIMITNPVNIRELVGTDKVAHPGIPTILVPTTAGTGSEVTCNAIFTDQRDMVKKGIVSPYLLPAVAIVDAELTFTVPPSVTAATGMDALVHAIESYTSVRANQITDGIALQAIKLISRSLRQAVFNPHDVKAREEMALGSLMAGMSFGNAGVGAVHALAYPLGGKFKVPHGVANAMLLVYVMKYNVVAHLPKFAEIAKAMGERVEGMSVREAAERAIVAMGTLARDLGIPTSLKDVGVTSADLPAMAQEASQIDRLLNNNPRWLTVKEIEQIYRDALGE
ncbi:iron-containing alcohol dehydrogenase [Brevibacillus marinus]|uniref:iron-containing alcohol dehydrogenase n=1 Tax=Brevibacillus marinus TaxID=2496837 RepID=UPI000F81A9A7|nr:iron-containing alcohol dehydrogenase [Brevibacillus marinus]